MVGEEVVVWVWVEVRDGGVLVKVCDRWWWFKYVCFSECWEVCGVSGEWFGMNGLVKFNLCLERVSIKWIWFFVKVCFVSRSKVSEWVSGRFDEWERCGVVFGFGLWVVLVFLLFLCYE